MKPKIREILDDCIAQGIDAGYHRAYKHTDDPSPDHIMACIEDAVENSICEVFLLDENLDES